MSEPKHRPTFFHERSEQHVNREWPVFTMADVALHAHKDDAWIVVNDKVYDMTKHVETHEGWIGSGKVSTLIAILSAMGTDCTEDILESHDYHAMRQIDLFQIGVLDQPNTGSDRRAQFLLWEELEEAGFDANVARRAKAEAAAATAAPPAMASTSHATPTTTEQDNVGEWREV